MYADIIQCPNEIHYAAGVVHERLWEISVQEGERAVDHEKQLQNGL